MNEKKEKHDQMAHTSQELTNKYRPYLTLMQEKTQNHAVLKHILDHGSITTIEAFFDYGITRLPSRIHELRHDFGIPIDITYKTVKSEKGVTKTYGVYTIGEE